MAFKNPITVAKLQVIKAQMYIKTLTVILKNKLQDGDTVPFRIVTNHIYNGFDQSKSEKIPLFIVGVPKDGANAWKKFGETTVEQGKKQKDFMVIGECTRTGDVLSLSLNKSRGMNKLPKPVQKRLNALLNKIVKGMTVQTKGAPEGEEGADAAEATAAGAASANGGNDAATPQQEQETPTSEAPKSGPKTKEEAIEEFKEEKVEEAKALSDNIKKFRELFDGKLQVVVNNVKKGRTTKKDAKVVKETNQAYDAAIKVYRKTAKQVQEKFKKAYTELQSGKETLYKLAVATKQTRKSLAQIVADTYFQAGENRAATEQEVATVQGYIKEAIKVNRSGGYKAPEATVIRAVSYVLKEVGIDQYETRFLEEVLEKRQAA